jgi:hypothetical protein
METQLSEGAWIDRFVVEMARQGAAIEPEVLVDLAREVWPFLGDLPPREDRELQLERLKGTGSRRTRRAIRAECRLARHKRITQGRHTLSSCMP